MTLKEVKALRKEMARIKEENEILHQRRALAKKAMAIFTTRNQMKELLIKQGKMELLYIKITNDYF